MSSTKSKPLVSIIIPTYNRAWIVKEAIDSVLAQEFEDFELIVVDDGSTDATPEILQVYREKLRMIRQSNLGVSGARNTGIAAAHGRLIAFLDSDDLWLPKKLSAQVNFFDAHPESLINQTEEIWIRKGLRVNAKKRHHKFSGMIFEQSLSLCLVSPSAVMLKKELLSEVGLFDESLPACEDYDLWLRISCRHPVHLIDKPLIVKRGGHADQLSKSKGLDKYRIQALVKIIESHQLSAGQYRAAVNMLQQKCAIFAAGCRKRNRHTEARFYEQLADGYATA